jgi:hypothetical protein
VHHTDESPTGAVGVELADVDGSAATALEELGGGDGGGAVAEKADLVWPGAASGQDGSWVTSGSRSAMRLAYWSITVIAAAALSWVSTAVRIEWSPT